MLSFAVNNTPLLHLHTQQESDCCFTWHGKHLQSCLCATCHYFHYLLTNVVYFYHRIVVLSTCTPKQNTMCDSKAVNLFFAAVLLFVCFKCKLFSGSEMSLKCSVLMVIIKCMMSMLYKAVSKNSWAPEVQRLSQQTQNILLMFPLVICMGTN